MGEHPPADQPQKHPPATYGEVLEQHTDMHPDLRGHVERLAATEKAPEENGPTVQDAVTELTARTAQLSPRSRFRVRRRPAHVEFAAGEIVETALKTGNYTAFELAELTTSMFAASTATEQHNRAAGTESSSRIPLSHTVVLHTLARHAQPQALRELYADPALSAELRDVLEKTQDSFALTTGFMLLQKIHDCPDMLDLLDHTSDDSTTNAMFTQPAATEALLTYLTLPTAEWPRGTNPVVEGFAKRDWGDRFLKRFVGLPEEVMQDVRSAVYPRLMRSDNPFEVNSSALHRMLQLMARNVRAIGVEKATLLNKEIHTTDFDYYSPDQLNRMHGLVTGDPSTIEHLKAGDVTLVFIDGGGAPGDPLRGIPRTYETPKGRTLCFEIHKSQDFMRAKALLDKHGIKSSTIVIGVEGTPGEAGFGYHSPFHVTNRYFADHEPRPPNVFSIFESREVAQVVDTLMQDSRGIDDPPEITGRRRVIIDACHLATPAEVQRPVRDSATEKLGETIVRHESMAETLVRAAAHPTLDVFAGDDKLTSYRKGNQVYFVSRDTPKEHSPLTRTYLGEDGEVVHVRADSIVLAA